MKEKEVCPVAIGYSANAILPTMVLEITHQYWGLKRSMMYMVYSGAVCFLRSRFYCEYPGWWQSSNQEKGRHIITFHHSSSQKVYDWFISSYSKFQLPLS